MCLALRDDKELVATMKRFRSMCAALLVVFALGVVVASAAQAEEAPYWTVGGTRLAAGKTQFFTSKEAKPLVMDGAGLIITCTSASALPGAVLLGSEPGESGTNNETVTYSSCKVEGNDKTAECEKVTEPITTTDLKSELVLDKTKSKLLLLIEPASGTLLATMTFPSSCKVSSMKLTGSIIAESLNEKEEPITTTSAREEYVSAFIKFPAAQPVDIWLIKGGVGKEVETKAFESNGSLATLSGAGLLLLAELNSKNELVSTGGKWSALA
jgi:hypothetical protein